MAASRLRPGIARTRAQPLIERRSLELWRSTDYRWRELFERADVISEGAVRPEGEGATYYGSTSVLLPTESRGGAIPDALVDDVARALSVDPHARVRAVRVACLEAQLRSKGALGRVRAELVVRRDARGVRVDVEVEARVVASVGLGNARRRRAGSG